MSREEAKLDAESIYNYAQGSPTKEFILAKIEPLPPITYVSLEQEMIAHMLKPYDAEVAAQGCMRGPVHAPADLPPAAQFAVYPPDLGPTTVMSIESVNHPPHYGGDTTYEAIKVIEAWGLDFCTGNAVKYISRAGKKGGNSELQDLQKALWYLNRRIAQVQGSA